MPKMNKTAKNLAISAVVGTAVFAMTSMKKRKSASIKRKASQVAKNMGTVVSEIAHLIG